MKEKLIELLGLDAKASDAEILGTVEILVSEKAQRSTSNEREKAIQKKITESGGALNREMAIMALDHQAEHDKKAKTKAKK